MNATAPSILIVESDKISLTKSDAVNLVIAYCKEHPLVSPRQATHELKPQLSRLSSEARWELIAQGMTYLCNGKLTGIAEESGRRWKSKPKTEIDKQPESILLRVYHVGMNGQRKPLIDFTADDFTVYQKSILQAASSLRKRVETAHFCKKELAKHNAQCVRDLPPDSLQSVEHAWAILFD